MFDEGDKNECFTNADVVFGWTNNGGLARLGTTDRTRIRLFILTLILSQLRKKHIAHPPTPALRAGKIFLYL